MKLGRVIQSRDGKLRIAFRDKVNICQKIIFNNFQQLQELDNLYGMFRIRGNLHQKAYQHKTSKAVERM